MLEDELVHVLSQDRELKHLILVENRESQALFRKLKSLPCLAFPLSLDRISSLLKNGQGLSFRKALKPFRSYPIFKELYEKLKLKEKSQLTLVVNRLRLGLHVDLELLKSEVYKNIREMAPFSDGILLFYGTCGHALGNLKNDFSKLNCPLYFLKDSQGETVEDCISLALGGNEAYAEALLAQPGVGTIYLTPMWASNWNKMKAEARTSLDLNEKYLRNSHYRRAAKINTGLSSDPDFQKNVLAFAHYFEMELIEIKGSAEIAKRSYASAKKALIEKSFCNNSKPSF